jgi:hypothetical protein
MKKRHSLTLRKDATRFVAVDPGDVWCGVAALELRGPIWSAYTTVLHVTPRTIRETIIEILRCNPTGLIVERYQQRGVGHQRWAEPNAPRIIGALEYVAECNGLGFHLEMPNSPQLLERMPFWPIIEKWRAHWQQGHAANWQHALSAWRILGSFMMRRQSFLDRFQQLQTHQRHVLQTMAYEPVTWLGDMSTVSEKDLTSTPVQWRIDV